MLIKTRLLITALLPLLMGAIIGGVIHLENRHSVLLMETMERNRSITRGVFELTLLSQESIAGANRERAVGQWRQRHASLEQLLDDAWQNIPERRTDYAFLRDNLQSVSRLFEKILLINKQFVASKAVDEATLSVLVGQQLTKLHEMVAQAEHLTESVGISGQERTKSVQMASLIVIGALVGLGMLLFFVVNRHILDSISRLRQGASVIGDGEFAYRLAILADDELGELGREFNSMACRLQKSHDHVNATVAELTTANREIESLSYAMSHNFRAPLRAINGFCCALREECGEVLSEAGQGYLQYMEESCLEMEQMVVGSLAMIHATRCPMNPHPVHFSTLVERFCERWSRNQPERRVTWEIAPGVMGHGDPALLEQLLEILLDNAWKFTSATPEAIIAFGAREENGQRIYWVRDNGAGFDMAHQDKLFKPFQRLHGVNEFPGVSLNLAIAWRIVTRHGGTIWAQGEVGKGALFLFTLGGDTEERKQP